MCNTGQFCNVLGNLRSYSYEAFTKIREFESMEITICDVVLPNERYREFAHVETDLQNQSDLGNNPKSVTYPT